MPDFDVSSYANPAGNRLLAAASNDPSQAIAWTQGRQQIQQNQVKLDSDTIALGRQKLAAQNEVFGSIGSDPTSENAQQQIMEAVKAGKIDGDTAQAGFTQLIGLGGDPQKIKQWAFQHLAANASYDQQLQNMGMQAPQLVDVGDKKVPVTSQSGLHPSVNPAGGPALQNGMNPVAGSEQVPATPDPTTGAPRVQSRSSYAAGQGIPTQGGPVGGAGSASPFVSAANGGPAPAAAPAGGAGPSPALAPAGGGAPASPAAPAPTGLKGTPGAGPTAPAPRPQAGQGAPGPMVVGLPPGQAQAQTTDADASAKQFANIAAGAANLPKMRATISNMEAVLPQITTGPQAAAWNKVKSGVNFATELATGKDAFDPHAIAAQDEFHNNAVKLAQQQFQQLGGTGTDGQLASASGDVPNESLSNMSNSQLLAMSKGLVDAQQAYTSGAQAWKDQHGPSTYGAFIDDWNKTFSPRAFQFNYLSPAERGTMLNSMNPQEKAQLKTDYDTAVQRGWIAPQGAKQ